VPVATLEAVREKKKIEENGHRPQVATNERLRDLLQTMEEVHLACIAFAHKYKEMQRKLHRVKPEELAAADPDLDDSMMPVL
jgi:hypothetical protein